MSHEIKEGTYVHYNASNGKKENGIVKSFSSDKEAAFVVYHWDDDPKKYRDYTGAHTNLSKLQYGWVDEKGNLMKEYCDHHYIMDNVKWTPINRRTCIYCGDILD